VVLKAQQEVEQVMQEEGEKVAYEANVQGLHPELIRLLGRLKYRTSYGQNVLQHSLECSFIAAGIAAELGADINVAKTAALLHDIGKAVDHEVEGPHALIGAEIAKRLGRSARIVHAIAAHHGEEEPATVEAFIVATADSISGGRPGARRDMLERYIQRLEALEGVANSFDGVDKSFAIQAGREVRILVRPDNIDDLGRDAPARAMCQEDRGDAGISGADQSHGHPRDPLGRLRPLGWSARLDRDEPARETARSGADRAGFSLPPIRVPLLDIGPFGGRYLARRSPRGGGKDHGDAASRVLAVGDLIGTAGRKLAQRLLRPLRSSTASI
jgi:putative nucleotidyltransferase with HDIG domain